MDAIIAPFQNRHVRLGLWTALILLAFFILRFVTQGVLRRWRFFRMKSQGDPVPEPYSLLWGHLPLMKHLREGLPKDAHSTYEAMKIVRDWKQFFPNLDECPPLIYMDMWPFMSQPMIQITSPELAAQTTQTTPPRPRTPVIKWSLTPLTGGRDLISMGPGDHKKWRATLNPAFSSKNITASIPDVLDQVEIFAQRLRVKAGQDGQFGELFTLYEWCVALTFDIIAKFTMDLDLHEQSKDTPGALHDSMRWLIKQVKMKNLTSQRERLGFEWRRTAEHHSQVLRQHIMPRIREIIGEHQGGSSKMSPVSAPLKDLKDVERPNESFMETTLSNLEIFLFAGHDTSAQTLCWIYWELKKDPKAMEQLRQEHDEILGSDPSEASNLIRQNPSKLNELRYTTAVIRETLRLHNLGSSIRMGSPDVPFVHNGRTYPTTDAMILTAPSGIQTRPDLWPQAMTFLPERFLAAEGDPLRPVKNAWRPFELGNTRCIGEELAMAEMKLALVLTVREFVFDFNYAMWAKERKGGDEVQSLGGDVAYRVGLGVGHVKDNLPTRVALRRT